MRKIIALLIAIIMIMTGCASKEKEELPKEKIPTDDGVLKIVMIGNSFSYYYADELYDMLESAAHQAVENATMFTGENR